MARTNAVEVLRQVFARYPRYVGYVGCTHCVSEAVQDVLRPVPLDDLSADLIAPIAHNAGVGTFGDVDDYKHFLPRFAELLFTERRGGLIATTTLAGLRLYDVGSWPADERRAVHAFLREWLHHEVQALEAFDALGTAPTISLLAELTSCFPAPRDLVDALHTLPDAALARVVGHVAWNHHDLPPPVAEVWQALCTAEVASRIAPTHASLTPYDDLRLMLDDALALLPAVTA